MVTKFVDIPKAYLLIEANDAVYGVSYAHETLVGKTWEFDPMSDAIGQYITKNTGKVAVQFEPVKNSMMFSEDASRCTMYTMSIENARNFWLFLKRTKPHYWFALDMAFEGELKGFDSELVGLMSSCEGCVTDVQPA